MTFGEKLQMLRARRGLSQDALAEALEVSRQAVSRWERNETLPETEKVIRLSRYFSVTTDYLLLDEVQSPTGNGGNKRSPAAGWACGSHAAAGCWAWDWQCWEEGCCCG